VTKRVNST